MKWFRLLDQLHIWFSGAYNPLAKEARHIRLTKEEHQASRAVLLQYLKDHPALEAAPRRWSSFTLFPVVAFSGIVIVFLGGWSVVQASEQALPGDPLYIVKVKVVEPIQGFVKISSVEDQAQWHIQHSKKRLEEAEQLLVHKRLTAEAAAVVAEELRLHTQATEDALRILKEKEGAEAVVAASTAFEATLRIHGDILHQIAKSPSDEDVRDLAIEVAKQTARVADLRRQAVEAILSQDASKVRDAAKRKKEQAELALKQAQEQLNNLAQVQPGMATSIFRHVEISRDAIDEGVVKLEAEAEAEAFLLFQAAQQLAEQVKERVDVQKKLKIVEFRDDPKGDDEKDVVPRH